MLTEEVLLSHLDRKMKFSAFRKCPSCKYAIIITRDIHTKIVGKEAKIIMQEANSVADVALSNHKC